MGLNTTRDEIDANVRSEDLLKRKLEKPVAVQFRELFREIGNDLTQFFVFTGRTLDASIYTEDIISILTPAYRKTTRAFSNNIVDIANANPNDRKNAISFAFMFAAARNGTTYTEQVMAYEAQKNQALRGFIGESVPQRAAAITRTNQNNINRAVTNAITQSVLAEQPLSRKEIGEIAGESFTKSNLFRGDLIGETEIQNAAEGAKQIEATTFMEADGNAVGLQSEKIWVTRGDDVVRPSHIAADFQTRLLDRPFDVGSSQLQFPGDTSLGAPMGEVAHCRCNGQRAIEFAEGALLPEFATPPL